MARMTRKGNYIITRPSINEKSLKIVSTVRLCWVLFLCGFFKSVVACVTQFDVHPVQLYAIFSMVLVALLRTMT